MTDELAVRQFQSADADDVISLWNEALARAQPWNEPRQVICRKRQRSDELFFVAERGNRVVATVVAGYDGIRGWIYALAVASDCRRQGIGRRMLAEAERSLLAMGCPKINLQVRQSDAEVVAFYRKCGFELEDRASLGKPLYTETAAIVDPVPTITVDNNIYLSQITWDDKPAFLEHLNETDAFQKNMGVIPFPYTELDADQWISKVARETLEQDRCRSWAIRESGGQLIGGIGICGVNKHEKAEMGYWLARRYWGRGIVTAAARRLCQVVFDQYQVRKIFAQAFAGNPASARVLEKAGFTLEGTLRSHFFRDGEAYDILCFGHLNPH